MPVPNTTMAAEGVLDHPLESPSPANPAWSSLSPSEIEAVIKKLEEMKAKKIITMDSAALAGEEIQQEIRKASEKKQRAEELAKKAAEAKKLAETEKLAEDEAETEAAKKEDEEKQMRKDAEEVRARKEEAARQKEEMEEARRMKETQQKRFEEAMKRFQEEGSAAEEARARVKAESERVAAAVEAAKVRQRQIFLILFSVLVFAGIGPVLSLFRTHPFLAWDGPYVRGRPTRALVHVGSHESEDKLPIAYGAESCRQALDEKELQRWFRDFPASAALQTCGTYPCPRGSIVRNSASKLLTEENCCKDA